ncbi:hypothetical protein AACH06_25460 [Ideonella sp. DXS29W]|uniref:Uncharacterized protein n=1 Tax=Ideonella lacteola TaxID=2984193 RepID=A0ABU9BXN1_9BURK
MTFDVFDAVTQPLSRIQVHNVKLLDVQPRADGYETLTIEHQGLTRELVAASQWNGSTSRHNIGRHGFLAPVEFVPGADRQADGCYFRAYVDPTLRRVHELDLVEGKEAYWGWICNAAPKGVLTPAGLIPGENGQFVPDQTTELVLRVPPEFIRLCRGVQRKPEQVLRGFIADAAGLQDYVIHPRADGYSSNGSDERDLAEAWLQRAYGFDRVDIDELEAAEDERADREVQREAFSDLLDDFVDYGGSADDLHRAVHALVEAQRLKDEAQDAEPT